MCYFECYIGLRVPMLGNIEPYIRMYGQNSQLNALVRGVRHCGNLRTWIILRLCNPGGLQRDFIYSEGLLRDHMDYEKLLRDSMDSKC